MVPLKLGQCEQNSQHPKLQADSLAHLSSFLLISSSSFFKDMQQPILLLAFAHQGQNISGKLFVYFFVHQYQDFSIFFLHISYFSDKVGRG